jgi:hypothetical protein
MLDHDRLVTNYISKLELDEDEEDDHPPPPPPPPPLPLLPLPPDELLDEQSNAGVARVATLAERTFASSMCRDPETATRNMTASETRGARPTIDRRNLSIVNIVSP